MSDRKAVETAIHPAEQKLAWGQMSARQRIQHLGKVALFFFTLGFVFPHLFSD
jgi:hypothetical protein